MGKSKKHKHSNQSEDSSDQDEYKMKRLKKSKKSKHKSKKKRRHNSSSSNENSSEDEWVIRNVDEEKRKTETNDKVERDSWMTSDSFMLPTFSKEKSDRKTIEEKSKEFEIYDPATSSRELNPYFKTGEGGLPSSFRKPDNNDFKSNLKSSNFLESKQNWKKNKVDVKRARSRSPIERSNSELSSSKPPTMEISHSDFLTDAQMNELGAKMLKAEMMGKTKLAAQLKEKLEKAKQYKINNKDSKNSNEKVILTLPTSSGMNRPISNEEPSRHTGKKQKSKRIETHNKDGERTHYYPDDDRFDIKQLFEREKYADGKNEEKEFVKLMSNVKASQQMDMADIFSDNIRKDKEKKSNERDMAIREAHKMEKVLDSCYRCFNAQKMNKDSIIYVGKTIYAAVPYYEGLVTNHFIISSIEHVPCMSSIDEEVWTEFNDLKKALSRFFFNIKEDVVFFETVKYLNRRPHMEVQVVASKEFEMIQFYFKKAIQECEKFTINKKLIEIKDGKNIRSSIPRGLPYFWIDFGNESGMAHVIEDQESFPSNFAQEIIGGMLNLDVNRWKRPRKEQNIPKRVQHFNTLLKNVFANL